MWHLFYKNIAKASHTLMCLIATSNASVKMGTTWNLLLFLLQMVRVLLASSIFNKVPTPNKTSRNFEQWWIFCGDKLLVRQAQKYISGCEHLHISRVVFRITLKVTYEYTLLEGRHLRILLFLTAEGTKVGRMQKVSCQTLFHSTFVSAWAAKERSRWKYERPCLHSFSREAEGLCFRWLTTAVKLDVLYQAEKSYAHIFSTFEDDSTSSGTEWEQR